MEISSCIGITNIKQAKIPKTGSSQIQSQIRNQKQMKEYAIKQEKKIINFIWLLKIYATPPSNKIMWCTVIKIPDCFEYKIEKLGYRTNSINGSIRDNCMFETNQENLSISSALSEITHELHSTYESVLGKGGQGYQDGYQDILGANLQQEEVRQRVGIAIYRDGRIYEGQFHQNQKHGFGCELYNNGNLYIGNFSQNKKHGKGSFYWFSLCTSACTKDANVKIEQYNGDWWGGLPDGEGEHHKNNGDYYVGEFKNGLKHGKGSEKYANGDFYKGEFINGLSEGFGEYFWADGSTYKGDFKQGYRNGYGIWVSKDGKEEYKGHYLLDRKHGYGIYNWGNNSIYKGHYLEDLRSGQGQLFSNGEIVFDGIWQNGQRADFLSTPLKKQTFKSLDKGTLKTDDKSKSINHSMHFRVKDSCKAKFSSVSSRKMSATTVKREEFQVNFKIDSRGSTHRGCQACAKRPATGEIIKYRRRTNFTNFGVSNPEFFP